MRQKCSAKLQSPLKKVAIFFSTLAYVGITNANPVFNNISAGNASVHQTSSTTTINQTSKQAILNWHSFNIGAKEATRFNQPQGGVALNRISPTQGASQIFGQLSATGKIILVNQAGIFFGPTAKVDVGGLIASTRDITDRNFLNGKYIFDQPSSYDGSIVNQGTIIAKEHGLVALVGSSVSNEGLISANMGQVVLASGSKFTFDLTGDQLIHFSVDAPAAQAGNSPVDGSPIKTAVNNSGTIIANGGKILMTAQAARNVVDRVINLSGVAQATSVYEENGEIILAGGPEGTVAVSGKLNASGGTGSTGGTIKILGKNIEVNSPASLDVSGDQGGGTIIVGGNFHGEGPEPHATSTYIGSGTFLNANALSTGHGGRVSVWSDGVTKFYGSISAKGGSQGGNGGFVETSGHYLDVNGGFVTTQAAKGKVGTWLLDPTSIYIAVDQASATSAGMVGTDTSANTDNSGTFAGSGAVQDSLLTTANLTTALNSSDVIVTTTNASGNGAGDIYVVDPISWASTNTLTLSATRHIFVNNTITDATSGGALVLRADNTGTGVGTVSGSGAITMPSGTITAYYNPSSFPNADISLNIASGTLTSYMLVNDISQLQNMNQNLAGNYALGRDLTWSGNFIPVGDGNTAFSGKFDGQNFTITNLNISSDLSYVGLFGKMSGANVLIENLGLIDPTIESTLPSSFLYAGSVVGFLEGTNVNNVVMDNVYVSGGTISSIFESLADNRTGGLVGYVKDGTISNSHNGISNIGDGIAVTGPNGSNLAGISGYAINAAFTNVYNTGTITGGVSRVGGIVGYNESGISISNAYNKGPITGSQFAQLGGIAGAIVANVPASISDSYNTGAITATYINTSVGGIVGDANGAGFGVTINNTYNTGTLSGNPGDVIGGIVAGLTGNSSITNSFNTGKILLKGTAGGIAGGIYSSTITDSYNLGDIIGTGDSNTAGGVVGAAYGDSTIARVYNSGDITSTGSTQTVGGIFGINDSTTGTFSLSDAYNVGSMTVGTNSSVGGVYGLLFQSAASDTLTRTYSSGVITAGSGSAVGGFGGTQNGDASGVTNNYWDSTTSTQSSAVGSGSSSGITAGCFTGVGCLSGTANLSAAASYSGWSISQIGSVGATTWYQLDSFTRPMLAMEYGATINSPHGLQLIMSDAASLAASYTVGVNIDASSTANASEVWGTGEGFIPIGNQATPFTGTFDGNGHSINNLYISSANYEDVGLFGATDNPSVISNIAVNGSISSNYNAGTGTTGILVGKELGNLSTVENAFTGGIVTSLQNHTGGLIGYARGNISNVYSMANVYKTSTADVNVGGLIGVNNGVVTNAFSTGIVSNVGHNSSGLVGGGLGSVTNGYWDTSTSGVAFDAFATGRTTAQLQSALPGGFSGSTWGIISGTSYPYLLAFHSSTPRVISGTLSPVTANQTINLVNDGYIPTNGLSSGVTRTGNNGYYYFLEAYDFIPNSSSILLYVPSGTATTIASAPLSGGSLEGLDLTSNTLTLGATQTSLPTLSTANLVTALGNLGGTSGIIYSASGNDITVDSGRDVTDTAFISNLELNGNITAQGGGDITFNSPITLTNSSTLTASGISLLGSSIALDTGTLSLAPSSSINIVGDISGVGNLELNGTGLTFTLPGTNTYSGITYITSGTLQAISTNNLSPDSEINMAASPNAILDLNNFSNTILALSGGGNVLMGSGNLTLANSVNSSFFSYSGILSGAGNLIIDYSNGASQSFSGASTYTGSTNLNSGYLYLLGNNALPSTTALTLAAGTYFYLQGNDLTIGSLSGSGDIFSLNGGTFTLGGNNTSTTFSGTLNDLGALVKEGSGTLTLSGNNTYSGPTTVNGGIIRANHANAFGNSDVTAESGTQIQINSNIALNSSGTMTLNDATLASLGSGVFLEFNNLVFGGSSNTVTSGAGTFTLDAAASGTGGVIFGGAGDFQFNNNLSAGSVVANTVIGIAGISVTTTGNQTYNASVSTTGTTDFSGQNLAYNAAINASGDLSLVGTNNIGLNSAVVASGNLTTNSTGDTTIGSTLNAQSLNATANSLNLNGGSITTTNSQNYTVNSMILGAGTTLDSSGNNGAITISGNVDGGYSLSINSGTANTTFNNALGSVSALSSLSVASPLTMNGTSVKTLGNQIYNRLITLGNNATLQVVNGGNLTIANGVAGNKNLTLMGSNTSFNLSGSLALAAFSAQGVSGTNTLSIQNSNSQTWTINAANGGSLSTSGMTSGAFTNIQNLTAGTGINQFIFGNSGSLSGTLNGGTSGNNRLNFISYAAPIEIRLYSGSDYSGAVTSGNSLITSYLNISNLAGNAQTGIILPSNKANTIVIQGADSSGAYGYINDPVYFNSVVHFTGTSADTIIFPDGTTYNAGGASVNGVEISINGITIPPPTVVIPDTNSTIITATYTPTTSTSSSSSTTEENGPTALPAALTQYLLTTTVVNNNVMDMIAKQTTQDLVIKKQTTFGCFGS